MAADISGQVGTVPALEVQAALSRVLGWSVLVRSPQLQRLLDFLVRETLAGHGERLKEYVIGVEVFGRPSSYDPRLDSLVRVEVRRLRVALAEYYRGEGRADEIIIDLRKGCYVPAFRRSIDLAPRGEPGAGRLAVPAFRKGRAARTVLVVGLVVVAVAVLAQVLRSRRATALTERDVILLADFSNTTGEPIFDETLKQGLATDLEQSPFLNILSEARIAQVLKLMERRPSERVTGDLAREVCTRAGSRVLVQGSIVRLGGNYVIGLTATNCGTGDAFAHAQEEAATRETILRALGRAAAELRGKLGESLASIQRFDTPIEEATTSSLEALQAYGLGRKTAREKGSPADIPFHRRAVEIDPNFALAYAALGVSYVNLGQPSVAGEYLKRAYDLRDRVSEHERYRIAAYHCHVVSGELEKANEAYELWKQSYPREVAPYINIGISHTWLGDYARAAAETTEALRLDPGNVLAYSNLAALYIKLERPDEAMATLQRAMARNLTSKFLRANLGYLAFLAGDTTGAERQLAEVRDKPGDEDPLLSQRSDTEAYFGRLRMAREFSQRAVDSALRAGAREAAAGWLVNAALREAEFGHSPEARKGIANALRLAPGRDVMAVAALAAARAGDTGEATRLLGDLEKTYPLNTVIRVYWSPTIGASIQAAKGNADRAIDLLRAASPYELGSPPPMGLATLYPVYVRGVAFLLARQGDAAAREFQKILDHPGLVLNFPLHVLAHLQLGRARALAGDIPAARQAYERFFELWKDADPDIRVLRKARHEYGRLR